ncbi:hypothetical protein [Enterococcus faecalis]|uniref:hypothetical protein n=1 Tax=Enterococcus faecalis TaxID=1351 RepID=UPI001E5C0AAB|nr:hypothetical protein [Enterococcus faecalis]MCD4912491.1 hypothetical protein [Enterococcus faecalis]
MLRKEYDHWQIEITRWNKGNTVYYIECECGKLARRKQRERTEFECEYCKREYEKVFGGGYVEIGEKRDDEKSL